MFMDPEEIYTGPELLDSPIKTYEFVNLAQLTLEDELSLELEGEPGNELYLTGIYNRFQDTLYNLSILEEIVNYSHGRVYVRATGSGILVIGPEGYLNQFCGGDEGVLIIPE